MNLSSIIGWFGLLCMLGAVVLFWLWIGLAAHWW